MVGVKKGFGSMFKNPHTYFLALIFTVMIGLGLHGYRQLQKAPKPVADQISFNGVTFSYHSLASSVSGELVAAQPYIEPQPGGSGNPPFIRFSFDGEDANQFYPPMGKYLLVYPTSEYQSFLAENNFSRDWSVNALQQIINQKLQNPKEIPIAPVPTASQVFLSNTEYRDFSGGRGVRFLTSYAQDASPLTNQSLLYVFQGLSDDGKYWVSFFYPVSTPVLPNTYEDVRDMDFTNSTSAFEAYLSETVAMLDKQSADQFTPNLDTLDALVKTITLRNVTLP